MEQKEKIFHFQYLRKRTVNRPLFLSFAIEFILTIKPRQQIGRKLAKKGKNDLCLPLSGSQFSAKILTTAFNSFIIIVYSRIIRIFIPFFKILVYFQGKDGVGVSCFIRYARGSFILSRKLKFLNIIYKPSVKRNAKKYCSAPKERRIIGKQSKFNEVGL